MWATICLLGGCILSLWSFLHWKSLGFIWGAKYRPEKTDGDVLLLYLIIGLVLVIYGYFELTLRKRLKK